MNILHISDKIISIVTFSIVIILFTYSQLFFLTHEEKLRNYILRALKTKYKPVKEISESDFIGFYKNCGVRYFSTADPNKILVFKLLVKSSPRKILMIIKTFLEKRLFQVEFVSPRESDIQAIRAQKKNRKIYIGITRGNKIPNSFSIRIE